MNFIKKKYPFEKKFSDFIPPLLEKKYLIPSCFLI